MYPILNQTKSVFVKFAKWNLFYYLLKAFSPILILFHIFHSYAIRFKMRITFFRFRFMTN